MPGDGDELVRRRARPSSRRRRQSPAFANESVKAVNKSEAVVCVNGTFCLGRSGLTVASTKSNHDWSESNTYYNTIGQDLRKKHTSRGSFASQSDRLMPWEK